MKNNKIYEQRIANKLEDSSFFASAQRLSNKAYTTVNTAKLFDILIDSFSKGTICEEEKEKIKTNSKNKQEIINYELSKSITDAIKPLSTVHLSDETTNKKNTSKTINEFIENFVKEYHEIRKENLINNEQGLINYVMEYFNNILREKEQNLPEYTLEKDFFGNRKEVIIDNKNNKYNNFVRINKKHDFSDVIGLKEQKDILRIQLINHFKRPVDWKLLKNKPEKIDDNYSFVFWGPPGTGKTYFAEAIANELKIPFFTASGADFVQSLHGEGKNILGKLFDEASKYEKSIIFIDEADALCYQRGEREAELKTDLITELLTRMDGVKKKGNVATFFSTNMYEKFDKAIKDRIPTLNQIYFGEISKKMQKSIFRQKLNLFHHEAFSEENLEKLIYKMDDKHPRALKQIVQSAASFALDQKESIVSYYHIDEAIKMYSVQK